MTVQEAKAAYEAAKAAYHAARQAMYTADEVVRDRREEYQHACLKATGHAIGDEVLYGRDSINNQVGKISSFGLPRLVNGKNVMPVYLLIKLKSGRWSAKPKTSIMVEVPQ